MRVSVGIEGGVAFFPGLSRPTVIDTESLDPAEARELEELVHRAQLPTLAAAPPVPQRGADHRTYVVTVEHAGRVDRLRLSDPLPEGVQRIVERIRRISRGAR